MRIKKQNPQIKITEREDIDPMIFWFICLGGFIVFMALSLFFENLKEKSTNKVNK